jgi:putative FmdB family regulatory protein
MNIKANEGISMPIYEYQCAECQGRFQRLVQGFSAPADLRCPRCGAVDVRKAVSSFAFMQSEESRLEALADPSAMGGLDENDPASIARWAKKMGKELGEDMDEDWDQMVDEMMEEEASGQGSVAGASDDLGWG